MLRKERTTHTDALVVLAEMSHTTEDLSMDTPKFASSKSMADRMDR